MVDQHWSEVSEHLDRINELSEEEGKADHRELAALVSSKVCLGDRCVRSISRDVDSAISIWRSTTTPWSMP